MSDVSGVIDQLRLFSAMTAAEDDSWEHWFATVGAVEHPGSTEQLMDYWAHGKGAAKVRWPEPCAFCRCLTHLTKYFPKDPRGLCANLEKRATGHWPNAQHSRKKHCPC